MRTLATAITAVCNSRFTPGGRSAAERSRTLRARVNSYTGHGSSTGETATHGASGEPPAPAGYVEYFAYENVYDDAGRFLGQRALPPWDDPGAWERANREALK
jgi:hypothetical protein